MHLIKLFSTLATCNLKYFRKLPLPGCCNAVGMPRGACGIRHEAQLLRLRLRPVKGACCSCQFSGVSKKSWRFSSFA